MKPMALLLVMQARGAFEQVDEQFSKVHEKLKRRVQQREHKEKKKIGALVLLDPRLSTTRCE